MNYELAKQLKEAGFPLKESFSPCYTLFYPTLSELIEAVMEKSKCKQFMSGYNSDLPEDIRFGVSTDNSLEVVGSTYEEAVANLWLELNKK